jgi:hypothetical protein
MAATSKDGPELHPATVGLAQGSNYAAITTVLPSGKLRPTQFGSAPTANASWSTPRPTAGSTRTSSVTLK